MTTGRCSASRGKRKHSRWRCRSTSAACSPGRNGRQRSATRSRRRNPPAIPTRARPIIIIGSPRWNALSRKKASPTHGSFNARATPGRTLANERRMARRSSSSRATFTIREYVMSGQTVKIRSSEGGEFDCYLVAPKTDAPKSDEMMPAIVLASAVHGVDADIRAIADEFAANGVIATAPDLFWRTVPGPLPHDDGRSKHRSQTRLEKIKAGERDLVDTLSYLRTL